MRVDQAIYGEVEGAHSLRAASGDQRLATSIANRLDLPDAPPQGAFWQPYVSGFAHREHYVIARTFPDSTASRGGMVFAHALIMPLEEICQRHDVGAIFALLATEGNWAKEVTTVYVAKRGTQVATPDSLYGAANALAARGTGPAVMVGCDNFDKLLASLWANLWPEARKHFSFRISFGPDDLYESPAPTIVCTPATLAGRWTKHRIVGESDSELLSTAAEILAGRVDATQLLDFGRRIAADLQKIDVLRRLESTSQLFHGESVTDLLAAIRLIGSVSPTQAGAEAKGDIVKRLALLLETGSCEDFLAMRNLPLSAFPSSSVIWSALEHWVARQGFRVADDAFYLPMLAAAVRPGGAEEEWRRAFNGGLLKSVRAKSAALANGLWRWLSADKFQPADLFDVLPVDEALDEWLSKAVPLRLESALGEAIAKLMRGRRWLISHGAVLSAITSPSDALSRQISVDLDLKNMDGVRAALRNASRREVVQCALASTDPRLTVIAAEAVAAEPKVFRDADYSGVKEQVIWTAAIQIKPSVWSAPANPIAARNAVLDRLSASGGFLQIVDTLSTTALADLNDYPERERLWSHVKGHALQKYLQATAAGWILRILDSRDLPAPDQRFEGQILLSAELQALLQNPSADAELVIRAVGLLQTFPEKRFLDWVKLLGSANVWLSETNSNELGHLALARNWQAVCDTLLHMYKRGRFDLKPALVGCDQMIGMLDRWKLSFLAPTTFEKWEVFVRVAADLYPNGPAQEELWERAGGHNADLPTGTSGGSAWRTALSKIRYGQKLSAKKLLCEMQQDYPANEEIRFFLNDKDIAGR